VFSVWRQGSEVRDQGLGFEIYGQRRHATGSKSETARNIAQNFPGVHRTIRAGLRVDVCVLISVDTSRAPTIAASRRGL
jgi:hypothetical protein